MFHCEDPFHMAMNNKRKAEQRMLPGKRRSARKNSLSPLLYTNQDVIHQQADKKRDSAAAPLVVPSSSRIDSRGIQKSQQEQLERNVQPRKQSRSQAAISAVPNFPAMGIIEGISDSDTTSDGEIQIAESMFHSEQNETMEKARDEENSSADFAESTNESFDHLYDYVEEIQEETTIEESGHESISEAYGKEMELSAIHLESDSLSTKKVYEQEQDFQPIIKAPVLLSSVHTELTVQKCYPVTNQIASINRVEWEIKELKGQAHPDSNVVYFKGILIAKVEHVKEGPNQITMQEKIHIPWGKTVTITWINRPDWSRKQQEEYAFRPRELDRETQIHQKMSETFAEDIQYDLRHIQVVSVVESIVQADNQGLGIEAEINLSISLYQNQYVNLGSQRIRCFGGN